MVNRFYQFCARLITLIITIFTAEPFTLELTASHVEKSDLLHVSWRRTNSSPHNDYLEGNLTYKLSVKSNDIQPQIFETNKSYQSYTRPSNTSPCEVYNFSVTATPVGATYTGDGCSVPSPVLSRMLPSLPSMESSINYTLKTINGAGFTFVL